MYGDMLFATGIIVWHGYAGNGRYGWWAMVEFQDYGKGSILGKIHTKYGDDLACSIDTIKKDAERLGIKFVNTFTPFVYYRGDGENKDFPPPDGWRELLEKEARRIGFRSYLSLDLS